MKKRNTNQFKWILPIAIVLILAVYIVGSQAFNANAEGAPGEPSAPAADNVKPKDENKVPELIISGKVTYNELEAGFYELDGYRLTGGFDFSAFKDKFAVAAGNLDESPSIYMVRTIEVRDIIAFDDPKFNEKMEALINEYSNALEVVGDDREKKELISNNLAMLQLILFKNTEEGTGTRRESADEVKIGEGEYVGQVDSNFIEIKVKASPTEETTRVFQLDDPIKEKFESYNLKTGDAIKFKYREREGQNPILIAIE